MPSPDQFTPTQLARLIGAPDAPTLIDVCVDEDFAADRRLVPTATRWPHDRIAALAPRLEGRRVVVLCQKGLKLSQGAAALLRCHGVAAGHLKGGNLAWRDAGLPLVPAKAIPEAAPGEGTLWVTRGRPKIDRIACPWLIRRFVDPAARFLFVDPEQVSSVAERFGATPFDTPGVFWSHRGDRCSFDVMVEEFGLGGFPALGVLAEIIRGADTDRQELAPQAAGLLAVSLGLSALHRDDLAQLDAGMTVYDALYRWARDAKDETHDWAPEAAA